MYNGLLSVTLIFYLKYTYPSILASLLLKNSTQINLFSFGTLLIKDYAEILDNMRSRVKLSLKCNLDNKSTKFIRAISKLKMYCSKF